MSQKRESGPYATLPKSDPIPKSRPWRYALRRPRGGAMYNTGCANLLNGAFCGLSHRLEATGYQTHQELQHAPLSMHVRHRQQSGRCTPEGRSDALTCSQPRVQDDAAVFLTQLERQTDQCLPAVLRRPCRRCQGSAPVRVAHECYRCSSQHETLSHRSRSTRLG